MWEQAESPVAFTAEDAEVFLGSFLDGGRPAWFSNCEPPAHVCRSPRQARTIHEAMPLVFSGHVSLLERGGSIRVGSVRTESTVWFESTSCGTLAAVKNTSEE